MKILLWSPWPGGMSGYSRLADNFGRRLSKLPGVELAYFSYSHILGISGIEYEGCPVFTAPHEWYGQVRHFVADVNLRYKPDVILQIFDLFTAWPLLKNYAADMPLVTYSPVDAMPLSQTLWACAMLCKGVIPQTKFARCMYDQAGVPTSDEVYHGVDPAIYHPRKPSENLATRDKYGIGSDTFLVLMVQDNTRRKNIPGQVKAWLDFRRLTGAKTHLLGVIPSMREDREHELTDLWESMREGEQDKGFTFTNNLAEEDLARLYAAADILLQCPHSEGFGLPIIEAGACGTPTIGTNFASFPELLGGDDFTASRGWLVGGEMSFHTGTAGSSAVGLRLDAWQFNPFLKFITAALTDAYEHPVKRKKYGEAMRKFTLAECDWDKLSAKMYHTLEGIHVCQGGKSPVQQTAILGPPPR